MYNIFFKDLTVSDTLNFLTFYMLPEHTDYSRTFQKFLYFVKISNLASHRYNDSVNQSLSLCLYLYVEVTLQLRGTKVTVFFQQY